MKCAPYGCNLWTDRLAGDGDRMKSMAAQTAEIRYYQAGDAPEIARLLYETTAWLTTAVAGA